MRRRVLTLLVAVIAVGLAGPAWALWNAVSGSSTISASAGSLPAMNPPATTSGPGYVGLSWTAPSGSVPVTGYQVTRYPSASGGTGTAVCPSALSSTGTSCTDTVAAGTYYYTVAAVYTPSGGSAPQWVGPESSRAPGTATSPAASKLVITTPARSGTASTSATLGPITVQEQNSSGQPVNAGSNVTVTLSSTSSAAVFAATSGGSAVTSVTIPAGSSSVSFYYGDTKAGTPTVTAHSGSLTDATQTETITAGAAAGVVVGTETTKPNPDLTCTGTIGSSYTCTSTGEPNSSGNVLTAPLVLTDVYGNPVPAASTVTLSLSKPASGSGSDGTVTPATLTIPAGSTTTSASFTASRSNGNGKTLTVTVKQGSTTWLTITLSS